jgi:H+/Cl- antiporter ClcA
MLAGITYRETDLTTPADAAAMLRSRSYLRLLAVGALLGLPISAAAWGFLALVSRLQHWPFVSLPGGLGFSGAPAWWPLPLLGIGGLLAALAIRFLPGTGGHEPAVGLQASGPAPAREIPGIVLAALASRGFGAVLGPEGPLIALGAALSALAVRRMSRPSAPQARAMVGAAGSFAAISTLLGSPILGAFLLMEMATLSGTSPELLLLPGLLAAGVGALIFTGLGVWSGLGTFSLSIPGLPHLARPDLAELGWAMVAGLAAALASVAIRRVALALRAMVRRQPLLWTPVLGTRRRCASDRVRRGHG